MKGYTLIKFTNCCYFRGGSKVPFRIRKFQNREIAVKEEYAEWEDKRLINNLYWLSGRQLYPTSTTKVVRPKNETH